MAFAKFTGWVLLLTGLVMIGYAVFGSYQVFTARKQAPQIFEPKSADSKMELSIPGLGKKVKVPVPEQLQKILSSGVFSPKLLNLTCWSLWAFILIFAGSRVGGLGVKLIIAKRD